MKQKKGLWKMCCGKNGFPAFPVIILLIGIFWLLNDLKILVIGIPWVPIILIVLGIGWIIDSYKSS